MSPSQAVVRTKRFTPQQKHSAKWEHGFLNGCAGNDFIRGSIGNDELCGGGDQRLIRPDSSRSSPENRRRRVNPYMPRSTKPEL
ncbi:hypothetical protein NZK35_05095 [Stieleria sp. ICT_E10.1]|uniref:hypothetical protein n=1 Tax=Stieleria sedimenti TaxID=2976331 RepID=UPI00217FB2B2|nr:hypothetical protein [Stieleria sedimenti]MCS7466050.1 hypothetical protein [Stieleria sedimenti]